MKTNLKTFLAISFLISITAISSPQFLASVEQNQTTLPDLSACSKISGVNLVQQYSLPGWGIMATFEKQTFAYVGSSPVTVYNINDPANPVEICQLDESVQIVLIIKDLKGNPKNLITIGNGTQTIYHLSVNELCPKNSINSGIIENSLDLENPFNYVGEVEGQTYLWQFNHSIYSYNVAGFQIFDITQFDSIKLIYSNSNFTLYDFFFWQNQHWAYGTDGSKKTQLISFANASNPTLSSVAIKEGDVESDAFTTVEHHGKLYYIERDYASTRIYDISNPQEPVYVKKTDFEDLEYFTTTTFQIGQKRFIEIDQETNGCAEEENCAQGYSQFLDITDPLNTYFVPGSVRDAAYAFSNQIYFTNSSQTFYELSVGINEYQFTCSNCSSGYQLVNGNCFSEGEVKHHHHHHIEDVIMKGWNSLKSYLA